MSLLLDLLKRITPSFVKKLVSMFLRNFKYLNYDSDEYWKSRAQENGQAAVLWENQFYNELYRIEAEKIILALVPESESNFRVLDIGCGIGIVSQTIADYNSTVWIDAVDFEEMIAVAKKRNPDSSINFISSSADDYFIGDDKYDLVISIGCFSAIRKIEKLEKSIINCAKMCKPGGKMLMIDPFHRWNYLARAKYSTADVIKLLEQQKFYLECKSGLLFWPMREYLANSSFSKKKVGVLFNFGETLSALFGQHFWSDYKVLQFKK